jgi:hypothetical protein
MVNGAGGGNAGKVCGGKINCLVVDDLKDVGFTTIFLCIFAPSKREKYG